MKIAICFRGINRSLKTTITSIQENIIKPAKKHADVRVFTHLYDLKEINNDRSNEKAKIDSNEYKLLESDWTLIEQPNACLDLYPVDELKAFGDEWDDGFSSFSNLIHALHSLKLGYQASLEWNPDIFVFVRPDLLYHDSFEPTYAKLIKEKNRSIHLPLWQSYDGCNDRFAIVNSQHLGAVYAQRIDSALSYCKSTQHLLSAEIFLYEHIKKNRAKVSFVDLKASRVRAGGRIHKEKFSVVRKSNFNVAGYFLKQKFGLI